MLVSGATTTLAQESFLDPYLLPNSLTSFLLHALDPNRGSRPVAVLERQTDSGDRQSFLGLALTLGHGTR